MKSFNHQRPVRNNSGERIGWKQAPAFRVTTEPLGGTFGRDGKRRLVVGLEPGNIISFRPEGTRQKVTAEAAALYRAVLRWNANFHMLEKARARKETKARQREARSIKRAEKRLTSK